MERPTALRQPTELFITLVLATLLLPTPSQSCPRGLSVAIDIGHSRAAPGAISATGKTEYEFNKRFAEELMERSKASQLLKLVPLVTSGKDLDLLKRADLAAEKSSDIFLSIHHDHVNKKYLKVWEYNGRKLEYSDTFRGFSIFVWEQGRHFDESIALASLIGRRLTSSGVSPTMHHAEQIPGENRKLLSRDFGVYSAPFAVLRRARMPALLLEVGVIANRAEERMLEEAHYRYKIQDVVLVGFSEYCWKRQI